MAVEVNFCNRSVYEEWRKIIRVRAAALWDLYNKQHTLYFSQFALFTLRLSLFFAIFNTKYLMLFCQTLKMAIVVGDLYHPRTLSFIFTVLTQNML